QCDAVIGIEDEERHVVRAFRVVRRERVLVLADLTLPLEDRRLSELLPQRREDGVGDVHDQRMPRTRRPRRRAPALELLAATLPELRRGLSESAARTVAYELFEKLGYGAVAVTDAHAVLAFVGAGADHHAAGEQPIRPVYEALAQKRLLL